MERFKRGWNAAIGCLTPPRSPSPSPSRRRPQSLHPDGPHNDSDTPSESHPGDAIATRGRSGHPSADASEGLTEGVSNRRRVGGFRRALRSLMSRSLPHEPTQQRSSSIPTRTHVQVIAPEGDQQNNISSPSGACVSFEDGSKDPSPTTAADGPASQQPSSSIPTGTHVQVTAVEAGQQNNISLPSGACVTSEDGSKEPLPTTNATKLASEESPFSTTEGKSAWYTAFQATVEVVVQVSDVFAPLKTAAVAVKTFMDVCDAFSDNREEFEKLSERVKFLDKIFRDRPILPPVIKDRRDGLARAIDDLAKQLAEKTTQGKLKRLASVYEDKQEIVRLIREISFAIEFAMLDVAVSTEGLTLRAVEGINWLSEVIVDRSEKMQKDMADIAQGINSLNTAQQLKKLVNITGYGFSPDDPQCVVGSRVALLGRLLAWAKDRTSTHAFWLSGMAGTGKTAVSRTLCHQLRNRELLGASFFCSIKVQDLSNVRNIFPSLARTLADRHPKFGQALATILELAATPLMNEMKLSEQYKFLILQPAEEAFRDFDKNIILCTDALDECRDPAALSDFLNTILSQKPIAPLKFFFTSRPEVAITQAVESTSHSSRGHLLRLHDIEKDIVRSDIKLYVNHELRRIPELQKAYGKDWPPPEVDKIVERADTLFIVAATIVREIIGKPGYSVSRLKSCTTTLNLGVSGVRSLYKDIMDNVLRGLGPAEVADVHQCLSLLVAARRPLSLIEYGAILDLSAPTLSAIFDSLLSVVDVPAPEDDNQAICVCHASFVDFLTSCDSDTEANIVSTGSPAWAVNRRQAHSITFERCLTLMQSDNREKGLYFGISGARTSYQSNEEQKLPRLRSDLAYACTTWSDHALDGMPMPDELQGKMKVFLENKGLYWLEALSAERSVAYTSILWNVAKCVTVDGLSAVLLKIRDFAQMFATPISYSAPHLYLSALPFHQVPLQQQQWWTPPLPSTPIVHTQSTIGKGGRILVDARYLDRSASASMIFSISPDGSRLAWGPRGVPNIVNIQSGEQVTGPSQDSQAIMMDMAFSPTGSTIVSGYKDGSIRVWDVQTRQLVWDVIRGHSGRVNSVAFSPDGSKIVSGSGDTSVRVWNAQTGHPLLNAIYGHSYTVIAAVFSPDGSKIVSGSHDGARIWDTYTGQQILDMIPHLSNYECCNSLAVSSDGSKIVLGFQKSGIEVWGAQTGQRIWHSFGGSGGPRAVAFSHDGSKIVSALHHKGIRVCDAQTGQDMLNLSQVHSDRVNCVAFLPDGSKFVSGSSDQTIRVWDTKTRETDPIQGHSEAVTCIAFSPDGSRIVSGSNDMTIRVWDAQTGERILGPIQNHYRVKSVAFSCDGSKLVASGDKSIRVWDAHTGQSQLSGILSHSYTFESVAFSPDGSKIVSGSSDNLIRVWDAQTGQPTLDPFQGHTSRVSSVAFSPDASQIVSWSYDKTIRVWDAQTGQPTLVLLDPLEGHSNCRIVSVVFSPDGSKIVSGLSNKTIRIWDAQTGLPILDPMGGHSEMALSVASSPDGSNIVSGSDDIWVWDAQIGQAILCSTQVLYRPASWVNTVAFSPDGTMIVSGSKDSTIRVWGAQSTRVPADLPRGHSGTLPDTQANGAALTAQFLHDYTHPCLAMGEDGWIRNLSNDLLLWVPPQFRSSLYLQPLKFIIGQEHTKVELSHAIYHGTEWKKCVTPRQENPTPCLPWPIRTSPAESSSKSQD